MQINPHIFRTYDIRGLNDKDLDTEKMKVIGMAFGTILKQNGQSQCIVGRDARLTSPQFAKAVTEGLNATGIAVLDIGLVASPVFYFSSYHLACGNGMMITASHNPKDFNGCKVTFDYQPFYGENLQKLLEIIQNDSFSVGIDSNQFLPIENQQINIYDAYIENVLKNIKLGDKKLKMVIDYGNGVGSVVGKKLYENIVGVGSYPPVNLYEEPDGNFPNHIADPTIPKNLTDLIAKVAEVNADFGIAFDGDADRIGLVTEKGEIMYGDQILTILSRQTLEESPGAKVITEVKASQAVTDDIVQHGGVPIIWKTGHSLIKSKMKEEGALLAGEMSGHIFFADRGNNGYDDAMYAGARIYEILSKTKETLSQILATIPKYYATPELRLECEESKKTETVAKIVASFKEKYKVLDIDGARVIFDNGWCLVRQSNTEPVLIARAEGRTEQDLQQIKKILKTELLKYPEIHFEKELD
ncbi:MAG TPA: phosphomannomutase/phosphoglucomutase [Patescibacteria group bacterium]|nr:phosphomannomutase/phosphoglucomutase [Patescibacteria group bacterium]